MEIIVDRKGRTHILNEDSSNAQRMVTRTSAVLNLDQVTKEAAD
jgi:hypothetical protein